MGASAKSVDFSGVKDREGMFSPKRVPAGDYSAKIVKVEDAEAKSSGDFQYLFTFKLKQFSQNSYPYYCKLTENQLWKLRNLLIAAGINVPKKKVKLDPNKVVGREVGVTMEDDEYEGKLKSVIAAVFPVSELADGAPADDDSDDDEYEGDSTDDEEEAPAKKKGKKGKKSKKGSDEDLDELDLDAL